MNKLKEELTRTLGLCEEECTRTQTITNKISQQNNFIQSVITKELNKETKYTKEDLKQINKFLIETYTKLKSFNFDFEYELILDHELPLSIKELNIKEEVSESKERTEKEISNTKLKVEGEKGEKDTKTADIVEKIEENESEIVEKQTKLIKSSVVGKEAEKPKRYEEKIKEKQAKIIESCVDKEAKKPKRYEEKIKEKQTKIVEKQVNIIESSVVDKEVEKPKRYEEKIKEKQAEIVEKQAKIIENSVDKEAENPKRKEEIPRNREIQSKEELDKFEVDATKLEDFASEVNEQRKIQEIEVKTSEEMTGKKEIKSSIKFKEEDKLINDLLEQLTIDDHEQKKHLFATIKTIILKNNRIEDKKRLFSELMNTCEKQDDEELKEDVRKILDEIVEKTMLTKNIRKQRSKFNKYVEIPKRFCPVLESICEVTFVISPSEFYIQVKDAQLNQLDKLMQKMNDFYCKSNMQSNIVYESKCDAKEDVSSCNDYCVFNKEICGFNYYRCKVIDWLDLEKNSKIKVQLVDYGDILIADVRELRPIHSDFTTLPMQALRCLMANLKPYKDQAWSISTVKEFSEIILDVPLILRLAFKINEQQKGCNKEDLIFAVDFESTAPDWEGFLISDYLLKANLAEEVSTLLNESANLKKVKKEEEQSFFNEVMKNQLKSAQGMQGIDLNSMSEMEALEKFFNSCTSSSTSDEPLNVNEAVIGYDPKDEGRVCKFTRRGQHCYRGACCPFDHTPLRSDGFTNDKVAVYVSSFVELELPKTGDAIMLEIVHVEAGSRFYCQIVHDDTLIVFKELCESMNNYSTAIKYKKVESPAISQVVLVNINDCWFRTKIIDAYQPIDSKDIYYDLFLVDYGKKKSNIPESHIRMIPEHFLDIPFQAVECVLSNCRPNHQISMEEIQDYAKEHLLGFTFYAHVQCLTPTDQLEVLMYRKDGTDLSEELKRLNFVLPVAN